jgi:hypothetical protein
VPKENDGRKIILLDGATKMIDNWSYLHENFKLLSPRVTELTVVFLPNTKQANHYGSSVKILDVRKN